MKQKGGAFPPFCKCVKYPLDREMKKYKKTITATENIKREK